MPNPRIKNVLAKTFGETEWEILRKDSEFIERCRNVSTIEEFEKLYDLGNEKLKGFRKERWKAFWNQNEAEKTEDRL